MGACDMASAGCCGGTMLGDIRTRIEPVAVASVCCTLHRNLSTLTMISDASCSGIGGAGGQAALYQYSVD